MEGANEAEIVTRVILNGTVYLVSVAGKGALSVLGFLATAAGHGIANGVMKAATAEKTSGQARLASLLKSGKELKLFTFQEHQIEEFRREAKRYGIVYSMVKRSDKDKAEGVYDVLCKAEDAVRLQRILERMGVAEVSVNATGREASEEEAVSDEIKNIRELMAQMLQPDERTKNPGQAADMNVDQSAAYSNYMEADAEPQGRQSVSTSIADIKEHMDEYQPARKEPQNQMASMLAAMLKQGVSQEDEKIATAAPVRPAGKEDAVHADDDAGNMKEKDSSGTEHAVDADATGRLSDTDRVQMRNEEDAARHFRGNAASETARSIAEEMAKEYEAFVNSLNKANQERGKE